jgi:hypothetical protein
MEELSRHQQLTFYLKSRALILKRYFDNFFDSDLHKLQTVSEWGDNLKLLASSSSPLWNSEDNAQNAILTAGKVQNLRVASRRIDGLFVPAGSIFSFWDVIGKPTRWNGYVEGREVREGCVIPTIAGGICQLSNALYDAARKAGFEVIERHRHTKVIKGSLAEQDRDATVKWNYVDLRFRSTHDFFIKMDFGSDRYTIKFLSEIKKRNQLKSTQKKIRKIDEIHDCLSCGKTTCSLSRNVEIEHGSPVFIGSLSWPEFDQAISAQWHKVTRLKLNKWEALRLKLATITGSFKSDHHKLFVKAEKEWSLLSKRIPITSKHLIIPQYLLPFAQANGDLWGRTYTVLATRKPLHDVQQELDDMLSSDGSKELNRFRVSNKWIDFEKTALQGADSIISPFGQLLDFFPSQFKSIDWLKLAPQLQFGKGEKILFPYPAADRYKLKKVLLFATETGGEIVFESNPFQRPEIQVFDGDWSQICFMLEDDSLIRYPKLQKEAWARKIEQRDLEIRMEKDSKVG